MRALLLGSGSAWPIPRPACACPQCEEARREPRERRTRTGLHLETSAGTALLDVSPDILHQLEREGLAPDIDLAVLSHHHPDHMMGLHDLAYMRAPAEQPLPVYAGPATTKRVRAAFGDLLRPGKVKIELRPWEVGQRIEVGEVGLEAFETHHRAAQEPTMGVVLHAVHEGRPVRIAYATDMGEPSPTPSEALQSVDAFFGDGTILGGPGYGHPSVERTIEIAREVRARRIVLTHIGHWGVTREEALAALPEDVAICRDGEDAFTFLA